MKKILGVIWVGFVLQFAFAMLSVPIGLVAWPFFGIRDASVMAGIIQVALNSFVIGAIAFYKLTAPKDTMSFDEKYDLAIQEREIARMKIRTGQATL